MTHHRCLIVVPTLNERDHIGPLLEALVVEATAIDALIVVADGGSGDGTQAIVEEAASRYGRVRLIHNPKRIQSAAVNLAVETFGTGAGADYLIRIDAHGAYPADFCAVLVAEADATGADSVVVAMKTEGAPGFQAAVAAAQNGRLGTGGSRHRMGATSGWVDHGHHALMRIAAFRAVGGYDESFSHNEDAELDHRLALAGFRIWMTARTVMTYFPRATAGGLFRQYLGYGRGRARNMRKHRMVPKVRQALPLLVAPALALALLVPLHWILALPFLLWAGACLAFGALDALRNGPRAFVAAFAAMIMHLAWSTGFWLQLLGLRPKGAR
jgi:succinoglycan biosynthesis protein ExoA